MLWQQQTFRKKSEDGEPAPLPDEVVSFEKKRKSQDISQDSDDDNAEEAEDDGESVEPGSDAAEDEVEDYSVQAAQLPNCCNLSVVKIGCRK